MKTALDPRHTNRQKTVENLFAFSFHKQKLSSELAKTIVKNISEIDRIIASSAPEFPIDRINPIDLSVLRLAVHELVFDRSQPPKVVIDEAIELAKEFGGENSPAFVNGALAKVLFCKERIVKIMADRLGAEEKNVVPEANLRSDLNATDIEVADLLITLEKDLILTFPKDYKFEKVSDIMNFIEDD